MHFLIHLAQPLPNVPDRAQSPQGRPVVGVSHVGRERRLHGRQHDCESSVDLGDAMHRNDPGRTQARLGDVDEYRNLSDIDVDIGLPDDLNMRMHKI